MFTFPTKNEGMENEKHDLKNFTPCMPVGSATLSIAMQKFYTYFHYFYWIHILKLSKNARIPQWNFFWYQFIHYNEDQGNNLMMLTILWNLARWSMYMNRHLFYTCQRCSKFFSVREICLKNFAIPLPNSNLVFQRWEWPILLSLQSYFGGFL